MEHYLYFSLHWNRFFVSIVSSSAVPSCSSLLDPFRTQRLVVLPILTFCSMEDQSSLGESPNNKADTNNTDSRGSTTVKDEDGTHIESSSNDESKETPPVSLVKFLGLAKPESAMLLVSVMLMISSEALGLYNPLLIADAYNDLVNVDLSPSERMSNINRIMMLALIIHLSSVIMGFLRSAIMGIAGERVVARTRNSLYSSILKQEIGFFDEHKTGELVSRLGSDAALLQQGTSQALPEVFIGAVKVLVSIAIMFWISPKLAGVMIGFVSMIMVSNSDFLSQNGSQSIDQVCLCSDW